MKEPLIRGGCLFGIYGTFSHDNPEKIISWVSFSFLYDYRALLGDPWGLINLFGLSTK